MKKGIVIFIALIGLTYNSVNAQSKFGYVNAQEILFLMPEMKNVQHVLDSFNMTLENAAASSRALEEPRGWLMQPTLCGPYARTK